MKRILSLVALLVVSSFMMASAEDLFGVEHKKINFGADIASNFEYHFDVAFNTTSGAGSKVFDESAGFNFGVGYNLTNNLYAGISTGYIHDFGLFKVEGLSMPCSDYVPILADLQCRWNPVPRFSLFLEGRAGALLSTRMSKELVNEAGENVKYKFVNYSYYEVQPGVIIRPRRTIDVRFSVGYGYAKPGDETEGFVGCVKEEKILTFKLGIARRFGKNAF